MERQETPAKQVGAGGKFVESVCWNVEAVTDRYDLETRSVVNLRSMALVTNRQPGRLSMKDRYSLETDRL